jgi:hypothetical protein
VELKIQPPWWRTDTYEDDTPIHPELAASAGPKGLALVRAWEDGRTDPGWGSPKKDDPDKPHFMPQYTAGKFSERRVLTGYQQLRWSFAYVMRSMRVVCVDIDGKNGGFEEIHKLGSLPPTLAETSKSGNGYHLFYRTTDDEWDDDNGFARFADRIAIIQGVDIRATGCVYHYPTQRWNTRSLAELPQFLADKLTERQTRIVAAAARITSTINSEEGHEILMLQDELVQELARDIPAGRRNNTLFAIGSQMRLAEVPDWEGKLLNRAHEVGLDDAEAKKLIANVESYS